MNGENYNENKTSTFQPSIKKTPPHYSSPKLKFGASTFSPSKLSNIILKLNKEDNKDISKNEINKEKDKESEISSINNKIDIISNKENKKESNILKLEQRKLTSSFIEKIRNNDNFQAFSKKTKNTNVNDIKNNINNNLFSDGLSQRPFSNMKISRRNISSGMIKGKNINRREITRPFTGKEGHMIALNCIPHNIDRNNLYSVKMFSRINSNSAITRNNILPNLREKLVEAGEKINSLNFNVKERTENLVKTQFYLNCYKNCCKILPNNSLSTNNSIMLNYKNMWNNVKKYTNNIKERHSAIDRKITPMKRKLVRSKSVRAMGSSIKYQ